MTVPIILIAVFVIVYVCTAYALEQTELRDAKFVLALPVGVLSILGMVRGSERAQESSVGDVVLIPYEALAYSLIFVVILWLLSRAYVWILKTWENRWIRRCAKDQKAHEIAMKQENHKIAGKKNALARPTQEEKQNAIKK